MAEQDPNSRSTDRIFKKARRMESEVDEALKLLSTYVDKPSSLGVGRRILVPPDEIHVVVGDGRHAWTASKKTQVFGQGTEQSHYLLNSLTQVIKLKTISFTVPLRGQNDEGIEALDNEKVSFRLWAHAVAKLDPDKAGIAAQRVGSDTSSLINTITKVGAAELISAAAGMTLEEIISNRQNLAKSASTRVNDVLAELGYDLALLTITELGGSAYEKLVKQAEARVSQLATTKINKEELAERKERDERARFEAEIESETKKKLARERLEADQEVKEAELTQQEALAIQNAKLRQAEIERQRLMDQVAHEAAQAQLELERARAEKEAANKAELAQIELANQAKLAEAEAVNKAKLARQQTERQNALRAVEQEELAKLKLAETQAEATRLALEQERQLKRDAERTQAEAERLKAEELAKAQRAREISLIEAEQLAEALRVEANTQAEAQRIKAEAETEALRIKADAETKTLQLKADAESKTQLIRAEAEATATEQRARAAKIRAEATRAETAAPGLAEVEVETARLDVAKKRAEVTRAEGLAEAEVIQTKATAEVQVEISRVEIAEKRQQVKRAEGLAEAEVSRAKSEAEIERTKQLKEIEIEAQGRVAKLYNTAPVLVELEKLKLDIAHKERLATIYTDAQVKAFEALAPSLQIHIYGNGGQTSQLLTEVMSFSKGLQHLGDEVPMVANLLGGGSANGDGSARLLNGLSRFVPYLRESLSGVNPRMLSSLRVSDVVDRLGPVISGEENMVAALNNLRQDASFRMVGDLPIQPLLDLLGINLFGDSANGDDGDLIFDGDDDGQEDTVISQDGGDDNDDDDKRG